MFLLLEPSDQPFHSPAYYNVISIAGIHFAYISCYYIGRASFGKPCGRQEQAIVNTVCIQFEYITKVRYFTNRLKAQSTHHYLYTNKRTNLHLWHPLISIQQKKNSIEIIVGITYLGSSKTVVRLPPVYLRSVCDCLRPFYV